MSYVVDYHIHSHYSDGKMSPVELVRKYKDAEYDIISITDHDGIDGVKEAMIAGEAVKLKVVPGVELSTEHYLVPAASESPDEQLRVELHILGYDFDPENEALCAKLAELKKSRRERNERLCAILNEMGYPVELAALEAKSKGGYVGKPHIADALIELGYIERRADAWADGCFFEAPRLKAVTKKKMAAQKAITLISAAGGMAVLAHPARIRGMGERGSDIFWKNMNALIKELKGLGLKGVECYHPEHSEEEAWKLFEIAARYHLHVSEGSDFHGEEK